ncbi:hypothetical protein D9M69_586830 [compost metagenome]
MREHQDGGEHHWPHDGQDDAPVDPGQRGAVDLRGLDDAVVDAAQAGEEQGHGKTGRLPDARDHHAVDGVVGLHQPVEREAGPAQVVHEFFQPEAGVQNPFPGRAGHDERQRHGVQEHGAQHAFGAHFLVQEDGQHHAQGH